MSVLDRQQGDRPRSDDEQLGLSKTYPPVPESVPLARHAVTELARAAGASAEQLAAVALAASEAVTNVVRYAYAAEEGLIHVDAWLANGELWILVADDGCGLQAGRRDLGLGQGLALISEVTDGLSIHPRTSGGTEVWMRFDLARRDERNHGSGAFASLPRRI